MNLIIRLQWGLQRLGLVQTWKKYLFIVALLVISLLWILRQENMVGMANASIRKNLPALPGTAHAIKWHTLYELDSLKDHAHEDTENWLHVGDPRRIKSRKPEKKFIDDLPKNGEALFLETYRLHSQGEYDHALKVAQTMIERFPNFQLGQLIYADLLASMTGVAINEQDLLQKPEASERLRQLKIEALQRSRYAGSLSLTGTYPEPLRFISPSVEKIIVVDAKKSRLYLLAYKDNGLGNGHLQVMFDAYVSIGNKGMDKWREGDAKTPVGVYFVQKHMTDFMLPDLYGAGALTLDYPNPLDKEQQRTGSGIWLHGSPSQQYARPPTATDGCVVLANDDMRQLVKHGVREGTPVLIAEQLNWVKSPISSSLVKSVTGTEVTNPRPLQQHQSHRQYGSWILISAFEWTDRQRTVAVLSHELQEPGKPLQRKHSYWVKDQQQWKEINGLM